MSENNTGWRCPECDYMNNASAKTCGGCGRSHSDSAKLAYSRLNTDEADLKAKNKFNHKILAVIGGVALLTIASTVISSKNPYEDVSYSTHETTIATTAIPSVSYYTGDSSSSKGNYTSSVSSSKDRALISALAYLDSGAFSRQGLIDQLKFEGYSDSDAEYAVDNSGANWYEQAVKAANRYITALGGFSAESLKSQLEFEGFTSSEASYGVENCNLDSDSAVIDAAKKYVNGLGGFSYSGLVDQLEFEGFSHTEAIKGADNCGADWNEQAVQKATAYRSMGLSGSELKDQLEFEGFTSSQASYGVEHSN